MAQNIVHTGRGMVVSPSQQTDVFRLAEMFVKSGFFTDTRDMAQAVVKMQAGAELGFGPLASMTGVYIVKGKVSLSANLIGAAIKRSGRYDYRVTALDDTGCEIVFTERGQSIGVSKFTAADAAKAGLAGGDNWRKFPRNMYFARALSNGAKWYCPDIFGGPVYTPDELGEAVDGETGEVINLIAPPIQEVVPMEQEIVTPQSTRRQRLIARIEQKMRDAEDSGVSSPPAPDFSTASDEALEGFGLAIKEAMDEQAAFMAGALVAKGTTPEGIPF